MKKNKNQAKVIDKNWYFTKLYKEKNQKIFTFSQLNSMIVVK